MTPIPDLAAAVTLTHIERSLTPELMYAVTLANILSPRFRDWITTQVPLHNQKNQPTTLNSRLRSLQKLMNRQVTLPGLAARTALWGWQALADDFAHYGQAEVSRIADTMLADFRRLLASHAPCSVTPEATDRLACALEREARYPAWRMLIFDVAARIGQDSPLTEGRVYANCSDIAAMTAAAGFWLGVPEHYIQILSAPLHYLTCLEDADGQPYLFDNKQLLTPAKAQRQLPDLSRIHGLVPEYLIASTGLYRIREQTSGIPEPRLAASLRNLQPLFAAIDYQPAALAPEALGTVAFDPNIEEQTAGEPLKHSHDLLQTIRDRAARYPGLAYEKVLYCYRHLQVAHPEVYLYAALRYSNAWQQAQGFASPEQVAAWVSAAITESLPLGELDRVLMPDEVLLIQTGSHRDRALLLYALLFHHDRAQGRSAIDLAVRFGADDSEVQHRGIVFSIRCGQQRSTPPDPTAGPWLELTTGDFPLD